jgi:hypothetical protein
MSATGSGFMGDYFTSVMLWRDLTKAQRKALGFPWKEPHPRVVARLTELGLWDENGVTRVGLAVALCRYISTTPPP